jgi:hypothetical protein
MSASPAGSCIATDAVGRYFFAISRDDIAAVGPASISVPLARDGRRATLLLLRMQHPADLRLTLLTF